jgi:hypothetical protein
VTPQELEAKEFEEHLARVVHAAFLVVKSYESLRAKPLSAMEKQYLDVVREILKHPARKPATTAGALALAIVLALSADFA